MKRLQPAFLLTVMASSSCSGGANTGSPSGSARSASAPPVATTSASASAVAPTASAASTANAAPRKRAGKREKPGERKPAKPGSYQSLHPTDKDGRRIDLANDDTCHVVVPKTTPRPKDLMPGERWTDNVPVDCPPELDDPAWDAMQGGDFLGWDEKTGACAFVPEFGNPPPPPFEAECPKTLPKK